MWHCPHCGAPQAESARCWVCRRSSTTCSTCRLFSVSLSADGGWCALDPKRRRLTGLEQRGCWRERPLSLQPPPRNTDDAERTNRWADASEGHGDPGGADAGARPRTRLEFIPVDLLGRGARSLAPAAGPDTGGAPAPHAAVQPLAALEADDGWTDRTSLFGELEA